MILSGHLHLFEALNFADGRPPQLVAGNGGTALSKAPGSDPTGLDLAGTTITQGTILNDFGFYVLQAASDEDWKGTSFNRDGKPQAHCVEKDRQLQCDRASK